jgi:endonuclease/exonuclease/phosphatase family metal-dependent hydrolase
MCVAASVERHETLPLGHYRAAQRVLLTLRLEAAGAAAGDAGATPPRPHRVWLVNTHLHHGGATPAEQVRTERGAAWHSLQVADSSLTHAPHVTHAAAQHAAYAAAPVDAAAAAAVRCEQASRLLTWMDAALAADDAAGTPASAVIVAGDLNAPPGEAAHQLLSQWGLLAAYGGDGGEVDQPTWPTPLKARAPCVEQHGHLLTPPRASSQAPFKEWGAPCALDFVLIRPLRGVRVRVTDARRVGGPGGPDGQLYPSDHFGVLARFLFSRCDEEEAAAASPRSAA